MIMIDEKTAAGGVGRKVVEEFVACRLMSNEVSTQGVPECHL